jgi:hypothetical protein
MHSAANADTDADAGYTMVNRRLELTVRLAETSLQSTHINRERILKFLFMIYGMIIERIQIDAAVEAALVRAPEVALLGNAAHA